MKNDEIEAVKKRLSDKKWRLNNLYRIKDVNGKSIRFELNWAQNDLLDNLWYFNVILKARQLGFSTFILIYMLDHCLFESNQSCGVIAHGLLEAQDLFENKVKFAYDNLPEWLQNSVTSTTDTARKMVFSNGSSITVGTSLRSGTYQKLHVSEFGKIAARYPDKAEEIVTGAFNTVHPGMMLFVESTAEGRSGHFYDLCMRAIKLRESKSNLTSLDPRLHFYPWWKNPVNVLSIDDASNVSLSEKQREYLDKMELSAEQRAWYVKKSEMMVDTQLMKREHPSNWVECFEASLEGAYYSEAMSLARRNGKIGNFQWNPAHKVNTFWDLGLNDKMCIWFHQHIDGRDRMIRYYENSDTGMAHYASVLQGLGYVYGEHYFPHDGNKRQIGEQIRNVKQIAEGLGIRPVRVVPRTKNVLDDIQRVRTVIPTVEFDEALCRDGITGLDAYRKQWNDKLGEWGEEPYHDGNSDRADAFRTFVIGWKPPEYWVNEDNSPFAEVDERLLD